MSFIRPLTVCHYHTLTEAGRLTGRTLTEPANWSSLFKSIHLLNWTILFETPCEKAQTLPFVACLKRFSSGTSSSPYYGEPSSDGLITAP